RGVSERVGVAARVERGAGMYGGADALRTEGTGAAMEVVGGGRELDSRSQLRIALPLHSGADLALARIGDELAIAVDGRRRLIALPAVLRRCVVVDAVAGEDGLTVGFQPDPELWMR